MPIPPYNPKFKQKCKSCGWGKIVWFFTDCRVVPPFKCEKCGSIDCELVQEKINIFDLIFRKHKIKQ